MTEKTVEALALGGFCMSILSIICIVVLANAIDEVHEKVRKIISIMRENSP